MTKYMKIFAINPGSTSTKIAMFQNEECIFSKNINHDAAVLKTFAEINDQFDYRMDAIAEGLAENNISLDGIAAFVGRGGGITSVAGGVYKINQLMLDDAESGRYVKHPANLGCRFAQYFADKYGGEAMVVNPPTVDEFDETARITGIKGIYRESKIHALNQKEIAIRFANQLNTAYENINIIIAHIGGGISVTAHYKGKMVDSNDIVDGDGPMAPTRSGALPIIPMVKLCFSGKYSERQIYNMITKDGGLVNHLGTSDAREVKGMIEQGDNYAKLVYDSMIYQIIKAIGSCAATLSGDVQGIVLTGGLSHDGYLTTEIQKRTSFIAPITVMAGEFEMEALAAGALRVLTGIESLKEYNAVPVWNALHIDKQ